MKTRTLFPVLFALFFSNTALSQWILEEGVVTTDLHEVNFWENGHGVILSPGIVMRSEDGGYTWSVLPTYTALRAQVLRSLSMADVPAWHHCRILDSWSNLGSEMAILSGR